MDLSSLENLGITHVIKRGTADILIDTKDACLVFDRVSEGYLLSCDDEEYGMEILRKIKDKCRLLMVSNYKLSKRAFKELEFGDKIDCYQVTYLKEDVSFTKEEKEENLTVVEATMEDLPFLTAHYDAVSEGEMEIIIKNHHMLIAKVDGQKVGFMGEHLEGSMGLLQILPEFRRRGYATILEKHMIEKTLKEGFVPFGQVEKTNEKSLGLQEKLGMTRSKNLICWMWK